MSDIRTEQVVPTEWVSSHRQLRAEGFAFFDFLTAVDETDREDTPGFDIVSHLYDITGGARRSVLVKTRLAVDSEETSAPTIASLTPLWRGAAWHERETYEMFGIFFDGFADASGLGLRKLLLPAAMTASPLRKSFVLTARASKPWPGAKEPGEREGGSTKRRKVMAPGVPDETWGPR